ncbi:hypothetical protein N9881_00210 [bacterium]|nr:hypothetical protein [bacterium]MDB4377968.1 hypothetical protein [Akkermansiaceae bacterium]
MNRVFAFVGMTWLLPIISHAAPITVSNSGFEEPELGAGAWSDPLADWSERDGDGSADAFIENIGGFSDEGNQHVGVNNFNYIWIDTGVAWEAEKTYTLKIAAGNRGGQTGAENSTVYAFLSGVDNLGVANAADTAAVLADPLLVASGEYNVVGNVAAGSFGDVAPLIFDSGDTPPTGTIVILLGDNSPAGRSHFDNVRLEALSNLDADEDGLPEEWETANNLNDTDDGSTNPDNGPNGDPDMDDRTNLQEFDDETDPQNPDSDEDGSNDGNEAAVNTDPLKKDTDGDGIEDGPESNSGTYVDATDTGTDPLSPDSDLDGRFDLQEIMDATDPTDASSPSSAVVGFGVNFVSETGEGMPIPATEIAGLREFAIKNWNNTVAGSITGDISLIDGAVLRDADGNDLGASAGTTLTWEADTIWQISNQYPGQGATLGGDSKLFTGYIDNTGTIGLTIDVNDIPYPAYDVIVYLASDGNDRTGEISIQDAADMELGRYDFTTNASQAPFELSDYVVTESTDLSYPSSQVAIFRGISGSDLTIVHTRGSNNSGVAGFQIVRSSADVSPRIENLAVDTNNGFVDFDATNLVSGRTYHLLTGTDLEDFSPLVGSDFQASANSEEVSVAVDLTMFPKYFLKVIEGPGPVEAP